MKKSLILLLTICTLPTFAQQTTTPIASKKVTYKAFFNGIRASQSLQKNESYNRDLDWIIADRDTSENPLNSYVAGFLVEIPVGKNLSINTGFSYGQFGYNYSKDQQVLRISDSMYINQSFNSDYLFRNFNIPLYIQYTILNKDKYKLYVSGGGEVNILNRLVNNYTFVNDGKVTQGSQEFNESNGYDLRPYNMSYYLAVGVEKMISDNFGIYLQPNFTKRINPVSENGSVGYFSRNYAYGCTLGMKYTPNKKTE